MAKRRNRNVGTIRRRIQASHKNITFGRRTEIKSGKTPFQTKQTRFNNARIQSGNVTYDRFGNPVQKKKRGSSASGKSSKGKSSQKGGLATRITRNTLGAINETKSAVKDPSGFIKNKFFSVFGVKYVKYKPKKKGKPDTDPDDPNTPPGGGPGGAGGAQMLPGPSKKRRVARVKSAAKPKVAKVKTAETNPYAFTKKKLSSVRTARVKKAQPSSKGAYVGSRRSEAARKAWQTKRAGGRFAVRGRKR